MAAPSLTAPGCGALMRHWRQARGKSQLDLSLDTGISQRHLSCIESGRSVPGRQTLAGIADALDIPLRERNALWLAAGYAPVHSEAGWDDAQMRSITRALERLLRQHEPYPAIVLDRGWNILLSNEAAPAFFGRFVDLAARARPRNLLHLVFDPRGLRPFIADWPATARSLLQRVQRECVGGVLDDPARALVAALLAYPQVESGWMQAPAAGAPLPVVPIGLVLDGRVLNYFSMVTSVGTPQAVAAQELRVESMFPADEATQAWHDASA